MTYCRMFVHRSLRFVCEQVCTVETAQKPSLQGGDFQNE